MKTFIAILSLTVILFSYNEETKVGVQTHIRVVTSSVKTVGTEKNVSPLHWQAKWYYKDLNTVFITHLKSIGKGC